MFMNLTLRKVHSLANEKSCYSLTVVAASFAVATAIWAGEYPCKHGRRCN